MWIAMGSFLYYAIRIDRHIAKFQLSFKAYDALAFSPARYFMLRRSETFPEPPPGAPLRWTLPENPQGLRAAADMTAFSDSLSRHCERHNEPSCIVQLSHITTISHLACLLPPLMTPSSVPLVGSSCSIPSVSWYGLLQGIALTMVLIRFLNHLCFQPVRIEGGGRKPPSLPPSRGINLFLPA